MSRVRNKLVKLTETNVDNWVEVFVKDRSEAVAWCRKHGLVVSKTKRIRFGNTNVGMYFTGSCYVDNVSILLRTDRILRCIS